MREGVTHREKDRSAAFFLTLILSPLSYSLPCFHRNLMETNCFGVFVLTESASDWNSV